MEIIKSNAVETSNQGESLEMKLNDFYFYYYLIPQQASSFTSAIASFATQPIYFRE
ncbi:MAG: hypothetical protein KME59_17860 [Trichormus sp. ATA11-4-KO1]|jgi:hypothetical protein|nr:hypothetical protein [Trichormus sp. ATA11-4-KO1]